MNTNPELAEAVDRLTPDADADNTVSPYGTIAERRVTHQAVVENGRLVIRTVVKVWHIVIPDAIYDRGLNEYGQRWTQLAYGLIPGRFYEILKTQDDRNWTHQYIKGRGEGLINPAIMPPPPDFTGLSGQALLDAMRAAAIARYQAMGNWMDPLRGGGWVLSNTGDGMFRGVFQRGTRTIMLDRTDDNPRPGPF